MQKYLENQLFFILVTNADTSLYLAPLALAYKSVLYPLVLGFSTTSDDILTMVYSVCSLSSYILVCN